MSLVKERPIVRRAAARPVHKAATVSRVRQRPVRRPRSGAITKSLLLVGIVTMGTYITSSVAGKDVYKRQA